MKTVLVTRPEPGATRTAERLTTLGFRPLVLPLTVIRSLPVAIPDRQYDAVAITSANALRHAPQVSLRPFLHLPCFAVGEATAELARRAGFEHVYTGNGDGALLAGAINDSIMPGAGLLYLTGRIRSPLFEEISGRTGRIVTPVAVYDTLPEIYDTDYLTGLFNTLPVDACLLYSVGGAEAFIGTIGKTSIHHLLESAEILCLSAGIAAVVSGQGFGRVRTAIVPRETALLEMLRG